MSIKPEPIAPVPSLTQQVAKAAFPKGNPYLTLRDELGTVFEDADFTELFSTTGQPGLPPWRLALITIMQFRENLSDRPAAEAVRSRIDWKYLLGLELTYEGFDFSVLSEFRKRLIESKQEHLLLDKILQCAQEKGLLKARGQQRTDSTRVLASVRKLNRLELVCETMRAVLNELASISPEWLSQIAPEEWYQRYGRRIEDFRLPKAATKRDEYGQQIGEDACYLLACLEKSTVPEWRNLAQIEALLLTLERHYEYEGEVPTDSACIRWKAKKELPRAEKGIESPYDIDARFRSRHGVSWTGYIVHLSETCDDDQCHLITHIETTDATVHEARRTEAIHQSLIEKKLPPSEHFVDSAYVNAEQIVEADKQQITMVGPTRPNPTWQAKTEGAYDLRKFDIDWAAETATCPEGKRSVAWKPFKTAAGKEYIQVKFHKRDCLSCGSIDKCTRQSARHIGLLPQAAYEALERTRKIHESLDGQNRYQRRAGIEGTISQGVRGFGLRRSRYRGLTKTHLQNMAIGAAVNIDRIVNWLDGVPLAKTRTSRFKALKSA